MKKTLPVDGDIYTLGHMNSVKSYDTLKNAKLTDDTSSTTAELKDI